MSDITVPEFWAEVRAAGIQGGSLRGGNGGRPWEFWAENPKTGSFEKVAEAGNLCMLSHKIPEVRSKSLNRLLNTLE